jgi:hypothetical protein
MDAADAATCRFYGRQKLQDRADPVGGLFPRRCQRLLLRLLTGKTGYRCRKGMINEVEKRWSGVKAYLG